MAYPRMTPTIGRLDLAQKEGKVLGEIERVQDVERDEHPR